jgi:U32 family peptidase
MKTPELLAPGGSFLAACYAFEAGADGVYLGLKEFSARAAAQNLSLEQLRRIRQLAADKGRHVYVTINTVIRDEELPRLRGTLAWLEALEVDGVIVQDLGVSSLVHDEFPGLALHASTQMGVHNDSGLDMAERMGIRRVILSRELPRERIRALRARHPGIELEVFIHGALCYSFSGACLASWALTGRSGNRGECAQVCRSVFSTDDGAAGHLFSTRDLFLGRGVRDLAEIGVDALKIEGRMKSPEYVFHVTRLYREVLDEGEKLTETRYEQLVRNAELGFSRRKTSGFLHSPRAEHLLEAGAPGHRGAFLGTVRAVQGREVELRLEGDLSVRDGVEYLLPGEAEQAAFSVLSIFRAGREVSFARRGETVRIEVPAAAAREMPETGQELRHLSSRFLDLPQPREASVPLYQIPVDLRVRLGEGGLFELYAAGFPVFARQAAVEASTSRRPFASILSSLLEETGDSFFRLGTFSFENASGFAADGIFVRPAELKKLKNELYAFLDRSFAERVARRSSQSTGPVVPAAALRPEASPLAPSDLSGLVHRQVLSPPGQAPVPFVGGDPRDLRIEALAEYAGLRWLPLPPVLLEDAAWMEAVRALAVRNPGTRIAVGLNNVSHLRFALALADIATTWFFADFFLYAANDLTLQSLAARVPRLLFAYEWLEAPGAGRADRDGPVPTLRIADDFSPPLFVSLGCFIRHSMNRGACPEDCPREHGGELRQGKNRFRLIVRDCVTYLFRSDPV